jgi:selenide,water dikinase
MTPHKTGPDIVLIGGGHAHALALRDLARSPIAGMRLTLVSPAPHAAYSGMLPGHIAGHYPLAALRIDLAALAARAGAQLVLARACGIDRAARRVLLHDGRALPYDLAALDIGITSEMPQIPGFADAVVPAKPLDDFAEAWARFAASAAPGARIAVIGGGVAGVELALACRHRLPQAEVTVYEAAPQALRALGRGARARLLRHCARRGVALRCDARLVAAAPGQLRFADGHSAPAEFILGTGAPKPADWLAGTGLALHQGFVTVGPSLQSSDPAIFASGDIAHLAHAPRPKAGVFAVRAAPVLAANLRAAATGGALRTYHPQRDYLKLISMGERRAVADKWGLPLEGAWLWRLKDRIDRRFMAEINAP